MFATDLSIVVTNAAAGGALEVSAAVPVKWQLMEKLDSAGLHAINAPPLQEQKSCCVLTGLLHAYTYAHLVILGNPTGLAIRQCVVIDPT